MQQPQIVTGLGYLLVHLLVSAVIGRQVHLLHFELVHNALQPAMGNPVVLVTLLLGDHGLAHQLLCELDLGLAVGLESALVEVIQGLNLVFLAQ